MKKNILFSLFIFLYASFVHASDGDLDFNFNAGSQGVSPSRPGVHIEQFGTGSIASEFRCVGLQSDEKIMASGLTQVGGGGSIAVARFATNGTLDTSFNSPDGFVLTEFSAFAQTFDLAVQPNNKTVVAAVVQAGLRAIGLARYNVDGSLDTTFGTSGKVEHNFTGTADEVERIAIQPDGKIVIVGRTLTATNSILVARVNADGSVDTSFGGGGGFVSLTPGTGAHNGYDVIVLPDGKILVAGFHTPGAGQAAIIIKLTSTGSLDTTTFGSGTGFVSEIFGAAGTADIGRKLLVRSDGKIILIGSADGAGGIARFNADGAPDDTFGGGGTNQILIAGMQGLVSGALQPDEKIVAVGLAAAGATQSFIVRVTADGVLDTDFGTAGIATFDFDLSGSASELVWDVAIQPSDGYLVLAGQVFVGGELHAYVARLEGSSVAATPPPTFINTLRNKFKFALTF